jgi:hypothetical protein
MLKKMIGFRNSVIWQFCLMAEGNVNIATWIVPFLQLPLPGRSYTTSKASTSSCGEKP